jgi:hypothetical protein
MGADGGPVDLLIGLDNAQWLHRHVADSWDRDDDMRLMKCAFGHQYMIMGGCGTRLFPRDPSGRSPKDQDDAHEDQEDIPKDQREIRLEEYQS